MFLVGIMSWWYSGGLVGRFRMASDRLSASADFFSISLLITTLFAPFRQISAGKVSGAPGDVFRAFIDRLISRFIGAFMRFSMIILGTITMLLQVIFEFIMLIFWIIFPAVPVIGLIMMIIGWAI